MHVQIGAKNKQGKNRGLIGKVDFEKLVSKRRPLGERPWKAHLTKRAFLLRYFFPAVMALTIEKRISKFASRLLSIPERRSRL